MSNTDVALAIVLAVENDEPVTRRKRKQQSELWLRKRLAKEFNNFIRMDIGTFH